MGRSRRLKSRSPRLAEQKKPARVDEYFQHGPLEMARMGEHVVMRNNMSKEQHERYMRFHAARLPSVISEINAHVEAIIKVVRRYHPLSLLVRGYQEEFGTRLLRTPGEAETSESSSGQRLVDYVQSMIAAVVPDPGEKPGVDDEGWGELIRNVEGLFEKINDDYIHARTADWFVTGQGLPRNRHEFYVKALMMWCNVTGHRYHHQEIDHLRVFLAPHSAVFKRLWNIDAEELLVGLEKILHALTRGLGESYEALLEAWEEYKAGGDSVEGANATEALMAKLKSQLANPKLKKAATNIGGVELHRVDDYLPKALLRELSWAPGECTTFVDGQEQSGWPTRLWPRTLRPFLAVGDSFYCFDVHGLFDNIYRVLQRTVLRLEPTYRDEWKEAQKAVSEEFPLTLLRRLCPNARVNASVFYQTKELDKLGRRKWFELDGLVCVDDHLFIVEVKSGVFTLAPPETGIDVYLRSIEQLIFDAADQGDRFLQWLESEGTIDIFNEAHEKIGTISRDSFGHITILTVTLDAFTELSAKSKQLRGLVDEKNTTAFWSLSISDLMTYTELFDNPLTFLHYVEKRTAAISSTKLGLDDEFDHYGMYLKHNDYARYADSVGGDKHFWTGYRTPIDSYFDVRASGQSAQLPRREIPPLFAAMVNRLAQSPHPRRRRAASFLLDFADSEKGNIARAVDGVLAAPAPKPLSPFSIYGEGTETTFYSWRQGNPKSHAAALDHAKACMLLAGEPQRVLFELSFSARGDLLEIEPTFLVASDITAAERASLVSKVEELRRERLSNTTFTRSKLSRNDPCPCGSGKKYKKCCLP